MSKLSEAIAEAKETYLIVASAYLTELETVRAEIARLREALEFYALEDWTWCLSDSEDRFKSPLALDRGQRARAALKERNE